MTDVNYLRENMDTVLASVQARWSLAWEKVRGLLGPAYPVDEMALYFADRNDMFVFISLAVQRGWCVFNCSEDTVETRPVPAQYGVEYWFLHKDGVPYRLECMTVNEGFSAYHGALKEMIFSYDIPYVLAHASFKVANDENYGSAVVALRGDDFELVQHCTSTYGRFSYFLNSDRTDIPALKPRINLRDRKEAS